MAKIEIVKQQDLKDCGACSLLSIIKYYKGYVPLEKIRDDTCTNHNGTTAYHLIKAAENYGFDAMGVKVEAIENENIYLPAIGHFTLKNGLEHFAVIYKVTDKYLYLMDPAKGYVKLKKEEFNSIWNNILILLTPHSDIVKFEKELTVFNLIINLLKLNKPLFIIVIMVTFIYMFLGILGNFYFQITVSSIESGEDKSFIIFVVITFLLINFAKVISNFIKDYYLNYFSRNFDTELFTSFLSHIFHLPLSFMQNRSTGEIISRIEELSEIKNLLTEFFTSIFFNSVLALGTFVVLIFLNTKLLFILCFVIGLYLIIGILFNKFIYYQVKENIELTTDFNTILVENVEMNQSIKNLNLVSSFLTRLENKLILMLKKNFSLRSLLNNINFGKNFIYEIGLFSVLTFGIYLIYLGELSILELVTFNSLILYLFTPIKDLIDLLPKFNYLKASFCKLSDFLNIKEEVNQNGLKKLTNSNIELDNVTYTYNKYQDILKNFSLNIAHGEKVFLSGPSGSGKSTICKLLYRSLNNYSGTIKLNNTSEQDYSLDTIRTNILYVGQNEKLFTGSIKENIVCFRNISDEEFLKVIKICCIEEIITKRPNRYNSLINASLNNLSGGEKQRIILARSLLKKTSIIILDEALSEVNETLEKEIIRNIKTNYPEVTLIYVSHKNVAKEFTQVVNMEVLNG